MEISQEILETCRDQISNGDTEKAIRLLVKQIGKTDRNLVLLSSRWKTLQNNKLAGVISNDDYLTNKGVIDDSVLTILDMIESEKSNKKLNAPKVSLSKNMNKATKILIIALLFLILMSIGFIFFSEKNHTTEAINSKTVNSTESINKRKSALKDNPIVSKEKDEIMKNQEEDSKSITTKQILQSKKADNTSEIKGYYVNADSYKNHETAKQKQKLIDSKLGYKSEIKEIDTKEGKMYRIVLQKQVRTKAEGDMIIDQLKNNQLASSPWLESY
jgi:hypothetical protein